MFLINFFLFVCVVRGLEPSAFSMSKTGSERQRLLSQAGAEASWVEDRTAKAVVETSQIVC